jgi:hypothetical protein
VSHTRCPSNSDLEPLSTLMNFTVTFTPCRVLGVSIRCPPWGAGGAGGCSGGCFSSTWRRAAAVVGAGGRAGGRLDDPERHACWLGVQAGVRRVPS